MSSVNTAHLKNYGSELNTIADNLKEVLLNMQNDFNVLNEAIKTLESYDGKDSSEMYLIPPTREIDSKLLLGEKHVPGILQTCYKNVWTIKVTKNGLEDVSTIINDTLNEVDSLNVSGEDLEKLSEILNNYITLIEKEILVGCGYKRNSYSEYQNLNDLFTTIKDNDIWKEYKETAIYANKVKKEDLLYQKYRTKNGEGDYVDFLLDEMGNHRMTTDNRNTKYGYWFNQTYGWMNYNDAFCAAGVSYTLASSGASQVLNPYIGVSAGAEDAKQKASQGQGEWHSAQDKNYQPKRGDIFFKGGDHTGIVLDSDENNIYTIEANTSSDEGISGYVNTRVRDKNSYITDGGYYTPPTQINESSNDQNVQLTQEYINKKANIQSGSNE